jgi:hypothetical protein
MSNQFGLAIKEDSHTVYVRGYINDTSRSALRLLSRTTTEEPLEFSYCRRKIQ